MITPLPGYKIDPNNPNGVVPIGSAIAVDSLSTPVQTPPVYTPPQDTTNYGAITAGTIPPEPTTPTPTPTAMPATDASTGLIAKIKALMGMDTGKTAYTQEQLDASGATALATRQKELAGRLTALNNESLAIPLQAQKDAEGRGITAAGLAPLTAGQLRENAIKALTIKSEYDLNAGQLENAKVTAQRAVDLKYKDTEDQITQNTALLELYKPFMTAEQSAKAEALKTANLAKTTEIADKKKQQMDVINAAQASGQSDIASSALQLDPNSSSFKQDLAGLQAKVVAKTTEPKIIGSAATGYYSWDPVTKTSTPINDVGGKPTSSVPKGSVTSGTLVYTPQDQADDSQALDASRGDDGYVDPKVYEQLYSLWIEKGGQLEDFLKTYPPKNYVNPANTWLPEFLMPAGARKAQSKPTSKSTKTPTAKPGTEGVPNREM